MATVWRYIVARVDASFATLTSAEENCSQATTTVKPSSAPYTRATVVTNGESVELWSLPTGAAMERFATKMLPTAASTDMAMTRTKSNHTFTAPPRRSG